MDNKQQNHGMYLKALPYLSILPLNEDNLDFSAFSLLDENLVESFVQQLLKGNSECLSIQLHPFKNDDHSQKEGLKALGKSFIEFNKKGTSLSIGYPLLVLDDIKLGWKISAPIFLWEIELLPQKDKKKVWSLAYNQENKVEFNQVLENYLKLRYEYDWEQTFDGINNLTVEDIPSLMNRIAQLLKVPTAEGKVEPCPTELKSNCLLSSAVIGQFEPSKQQSKQLPKFIEPRQRIKWTNRFAAEELSATNYTSLQKIWKGRSFTVTRQEDDYTLLQASLPVILSDQANAVVLSDNATSLDIIYKDLLTKGMPSDGILLLTGSDTDKEQFLEKLEQQANRKKRKLFFDESSFKPKVEQLHRLTEKLETGQMFANRPVFEAQSWTDLTADFLNKHYEERKHLLSSVLDSSGGYFSFTVDEYNFLQKELEKQLSLFQPIRTTEHPLTAIQEVFFKNSSLYEARETVLATVRVLRKRLQHIYHQFLDFTDSFADQEKFALSSYARKLHQQIEEINSDITLYIDIYGDDFEQQGALKNAKIRLLSMFSTKHQDIRRLKQTLHKKYDELIRLYESKKYFVTNLPDIHKQTSLTGMAESLDKFQKTLLTWEAGIGNRVQQQLNKLEANQLQNPLVQQQLQGIESSLELLLKEVNELGLFKQQFIIEDKILLKKEKQIRLYLKFLLEIERSLPLFDQYYAWRQHWLNTDVKVQKLMLALENCLANDWMKAFQSWYLHHLLEKHYNLALPTTSVEFSKFFELEKELSTYLADKAAYAIRIKQEQQARQSKKEKDFTITKARSFFENKTLPEIFAWLGQDAVNNFFPLILTTNKIGSLLFEEARSSTDILFSIQTINWITEEVKHLDSLTNQHITLSSTSVSKQSSSNLKDPQALQQALIQYIKDFIDPKSIRVDKKFGLVIERSQGTKVILLIDEGLEGMSPYAYKAEMQRRSEILEAGYQLYPLYSVDLWHFPFKTIEKLVAFLLKDERALIAKEV